jgi:hypothetical protein
MWDEWLTSPDLSSVTILRTKWNLNTKWYSLAYRFTNSVIWSRIRLKRVWYKAEVLNWLSTNLTI